MPLTIETGAGVIGADSFATVAEFEQFGQDYFGHVAGGSVAHKEGALRRSFAYMHSLNWRDDVSFPTFGGTIPAAIKQAQSAFAQVELATVGALQPNVVSGQQKVLNKVGELGWQVTGSSGVDSQRTSVLMANDFLRDYLRLDGASQYFLRG